MSKGYNVITGNIIIKQQIITNIEQHWRPLNGVITYLVVSIMVGTYVESTEEMWGTLSGIFEVFPPCMVISVEIELQKSTDGPLGVKSGVSYVAIRSIQT